MNNTDLKAWLEKEIGGVGNHASEMVRPPDNATCYYDGKLGAYRAVLSRLEADPEPGGMDPKMRAELEEITSHYERIQDGYQSGPSTKYILARHLLDTYGKRRVCKWRCDPDVEVNILREGLWWTGCGHNNTSIIGFMFCPFCGGTIEEVE